MNIDSNSFPADRELVITRILDAPRNKIFRAWTEAELLKQWFAPKPFETAHVELDVRRGGSSLIVMRGPDGTEMASRGVYLEVVENERLVFTDAFTSAWEPSEKPFVAVTLTFEAIDQTTRYTARARHWSSADREMHESMGFHEGWSQCADQLLEVARKI